MKVTPDPLNWEAGGYRVKRRLKWKGQGPVISAAQRLVCLKVQMLMDFNHLEVVIFLKAQRMWKSIPSNAKYLAFWLEAHWVWDISSPSTSSPTPTPTPKERYKRLQFCSITITGKALVTHQQAEGRQGRVTSELSAIVP